MLEKMLEMSGSEGGGESAELQVLKEIKQLMDSRLGDKLKGAVSVSKVEIEPKEEGGLELEQEPEMESSDLSPEEEDELNKIRSKMV